MKQARCEESPQELVNIKENLLDTGKMPILFIDHGSPINIILKNSFTDSLAKLGKNIPRPKAIMVISADC